MEQIIFNKNNLKEEEIDQRKVRVKAFFVDDKKLLLIKSVEGYHLIGGHVEEGESFSEALVREICEETGLEIKMADIGEPFLKISHYIPNYRETGKNVMAEMIYYKVCCNRPPLLEKRCLTESEISKNYELVYLHFDDFLQEVERGVMQEYPISRKITDEMKLAFKKFLQRYY